MKNQEYDYLGNKIMIYLIKDNLFRVTLPNFIKFKKMKEKENIITKEWIKALDYYFLEEQNVSNFEKQGITRIGIQKETKIFCFEMKDSTVTYKNLFEICRKTGWFFYLTGIALEESLLSKKIDIIHKRFDISEITCWKIKNNSHAQIIVISAKPNANSFLLKFDNISILLDAGFDNRPQYSKYIQKIKENSSKLDAIFISHAHSDHDRALERLTTEFKDTPIICSSTTLDFFIYKKSKKIFGDNSIEDFRYNDSLNELIEKTLRIRCGQEINFSGGKLNFYSAGHMPGAMMLCVTINDFKFLYTGDFSFFDYFPITGVGKIIDNIPQKIDCVLLDATMSDLEYQAPGYIFKGLLNRLKIKALYDNNVLLTADSSSTAIVLYISIFNYFRSLQIREEFEKRPSLVLGLETLEYAKIIQHRVDDIHPTMKVQLERKLNPFSSAISRFCTTFEEIQEYIEKGNCIFIFGENDLRKGMSRKLFKIMSKQKDNLIFLTGALRSEESIELASGNNRINFNGTTITNEAEIFNVTRPKNTINFHADLIQIEKLLDKIQPEKVALFHATPRKMIKIRARLSKTSYVHETVALSEDEQIINLK